METTCFLIIPIILTSMLIIASHRKTHTFMTTYTTFKTPRKKKSCDKKILLLKTGHISHKGKNISTLNRTIRFHNVLFIFIIYC